MKLTAKMLDHLVQVLSGNDEQIKILYKNLEEKLFEKEEKVLVLTQLKETLDRLTHVQDDLAYNIQLIEHRDSDLSRLEHKVRQLQVALVDK